MRRKPELKIWPQRLMAVSERKTECRNQRAARHEGRPARAGSGRFSACKVLIVAETYIVFLITALVLSVAALGLEMIFRRALEAEAALRQAETNLKNVRNAAAHGRDLALVDVVDDGTVQQGDCPYFKRVGGRRAADARCGAAA